MAYIRVKRGKFKVEINKKGYPRVFKSFHTIKDAKKFAKEVESQMEREVVNDLLKKSFGKNYSDN